MWTALRTVETRANADGSATTHVVVRCVLADVARATNLRVEDAAFALNECGLLVRGPCSHFGAGDDDADANGVDGHGGEEVGELVITREMVERVAVERDVKRPCIDLAHVLL